MKLDSAVLGPLTGVSGKKLVTRARGQIGRLSALVIGRSITSFALQLGGGLYWTVLKGAAVALSHAARPSVPHSRKDDPVRQLYDAMKREDPDVVSRRTFDCWAEGALLGCADDGLITLPKRVGNQKQPKPSDIAALRKITWRQLRAIAKKFRSMEKLRTALR